MKGSRVYLRIEEEVKEQWVKRAKEKGVTLSDYVRTLVEPEMAVEREKPKIKVSVSRRAEPSRAEPEFRTYFK